MYDLIIIGAGPAGLTAGIYAARREMKTLIIGQEIGGQMMWATDIENYPGFKSVNAFDLIAKMKEQVDALGVAIKTSEAKKIEIKADSFLVYTEKEKFEARSLVLAMGQKPSRLKIPGEKEFSGQGVSYCANCDGPFFRGKDVAVIGDSASALDAAEYLSKIAKKVYLISSRPEFKGPEALIKEVESRENISILKETKVLEIKGDKNVEALTIKNLESVEETELRLDGVFIEIGRTAHTDLVEDLVLRDERNQIIADQDGQTKTPGVFAAGDVTTTAFKQISVAVGSGTIAALSAYRYLQLKAGKSGIVSDRSMPKKN